MTFKQLFFFAFMVTAATSVVAATPEQFLRSLRAPEEIIRSVLHDNTNINRCVVTSSHILCVQGRTYPNIQGNAFARNAVLQGLGISVRANLAKAMTAKIKATNLLDGRAVGQALVNTQEQGKFALKGMEFLTFTSGDWCGAIAAAPVAPAQRELPSLYAQKPFITEYCETLLPEAVDLMAAGKSQEALLRLKELHDLKFANITAYLLAAKAFIQEKQPAEAKKIAEELLIDFHQKLDADEAERLGDLFTELNCANEAETCYKLASERLNEH